MNPVNLSRGWTEIHGMDCPSNLGINYRRPRGDNRYEREKHESVKKIIVIRIKYQVEHDSFRSSLKLVWGYDVQQEKKEGRKRMEKIGRLEKGETKRG